MFVLLSFYGQANSALLLGYRLALDGWCLIWEITAVSLKVKCIFCIPLTLFDILENGFNVLKSTYYGRKFEDSATNSSSATATLNVYINRLWWQEITMHKCYGFWCADTQFKFQKLFLIDLRVIREKDAQVYPFSCSKEADVLKDRGVFIFLDCTLEMKAQLCCKHQIPAIPTT